MATLLKVSKEKEMEKSSMTAEDIRNKLFYFHQALPTWLKTKVAIILEFHWPLIHSLKEQWVKTHN
jgi:hypothetical protein